MKITRWRDRLLELCDGAVENHCPRRPPCEAPDPDDGKPLDVDDWCSLCLLVHDVRDLASELPCPAKEESNG